MDYPEQNGQKEIVSDFQENYHTGWIKLYRSIRKHWIHENPLYFRAWCDILLEVNHEGKKVLIENELIYCERGEAVYSINSWIKIFGEEWSRQKVRTFFNLLEKDSMIVTKGLRKTTKLTVINYDTYQDTLTNRQPTANQQLTNRQPQLKNDKNVKNDKNIIVSSKKQKKQCPPPSENGRIPPRKILLEIWNKHAKTVPKIIEPFAKERLDKAGVRLNFHAHCKCHDDVDDYLHDWEIACIACNLLPFTRGENDRNWKANIDWLLRNDVNMDKIFEGKYGQVPYAQIESIIDGHGRSATAKSQ